MIFYPESILLRSSKYRGSLSKLQMRLEYETLEDAYFSVQYLEGFKTYEEGGCKRQYEVMATQHFIDERTALAHYFYRQKIEPWKVAHLDETLVAQWWHVGL